MSSVEDLIKSRNNHFEKATTDILSLYVDKLNGVLSTMLHKPVTVVWNTISIHADFGDKIVNITGFLPMDIGESVIDSDGYEVIINEYNAQEYSKFIKLFLTPNQLDNKTVDEIVTDLGTVFTSPKAMVGDELDGLVNAKSLKANDTFSKLLDTVTGSKTKH